MTPSKPEKPSISVRIWGHFSGLGEEFPDPGRAHAHDHLDELRCRGREERNARLPRHGTREQGLSRAGRTREEHTARHLRAHPAVRVRILEEVDDVVQFALDLVDSGHVGEGRALGAGLQFDRFRGCLAAEHAARASDARPQPPGEEHPQQYQEHDGGQGDQQVGEEAALLDHR
jgi:hypothetical protein